MIATGTLRVGIFTLILSTTLLAETIPFDYWYGRVIGRTQIQAIHDAFNGETGSLSTSLKVGHGDNVSVNLGKLLEIIPAREPNAFELSFQRPDLKADVALGPRLRWHIESLDWIQGLDNYSTQYATNFGNSYRFDSDQSLQLLHKDIEYDSTRSLYYYTSGMYLQPRNWNLDARLTFEFGASYYDMLDRAAWPWYRPGMDSRIKSDSHGREIGASAVFSYGLSRRMQLTAGWAIVTSNDPFEKSSTMFAETNPSEVVLRESSVGEWIDRSYEVFVEPLYMHNNHHWMSIRPSYKSDRTTMSSNDRNEVGVTGLNQAVVSDLYETRRYAVTLRHTWIANDVVIGREQILDDATGYYGHRLTKGSIRFSTFAEMSSIREKSEWRKRWNGSQVGSVDKETQENDLLSVTSEATYFSPLDVDVSVKFSLDRESFGMGTYRPISDFSHSQEYGFTLALSYYSYRWTPENRQSVKWNRISDIDYLFGPLLLPGDWCAKITAELPVHYWNSNSNEGSVFNFFKGESNNSWHWTFSTGVGVFEGIEAGLDVVYSQYVHSSGSPIGDWYHSRADDWHVNPRFRWQPGQRFRVDFSVSENYWDYEWQARYRDRIIGQSEYVHTWKINVVYHIIA